MSITENFLKQRVSTPQPGKWSSKFTATKNYADGNDLPLVAIWSNGDGCSHCQDLEEALMKKTFKDWMSQSGCIFYFACNLDKSADDKYEGKGFHWCRKDVLTAFPFVRVWWKGHGVDKIMIGDTLLNNKTANAGAKKAVKTLKKLLKNFKPKTDNVKYVTYQTAKQATATTDSSKTYGIPSKFIADKNYQNMLLDLDSNCSDFLGWENECGFNTSSTSLSGSAGEKRTFDDYCSAAQKTYRPMFIIYEEAYNKGSNAFNASINRWARAIRTALATFSSCQADSFDESTKKYGFYIILYQNKAGGGVAEADKVKKFITQYGSIPTGYPWYMVYQYQEDDSIFARYGSLQTTSDESWHNDIDMLPSEQIYSKFGEVLNTVGAEIQYVYDGEEQEDQFETLTIHFDSNGGEGTLDQIEILAENNVAYVQLPSRSVVEANVVRDGYTAVQFIDSSGIKCNFESQVQISYSTTFTIEWSRTASPDPVNKHKSTKISGSTIACASSKFPIFHTYSSMGQKVSRFSSNISSFGAIGPMTPHNGIASQVVDVYFSDSTVEVLPSCFMNCSQLTSVQNDNNIRILGDYSFYGCNSLKSVNFLQDGAHELCMVGDCAFMRSGLEKVNVYLKSSVSDTGYGVSCFAECTALTSVNLQGAPFLAGHMFDGCTNLKTITMANKHNYVYEYCFANCQSLTEITLPANMYMLSPHMFDGCTNLKSVKFENGSILKQLGDHVFANCPKLTSIVLPQSIDSIEYIDAEFLAGSSIDEVTFKGLSDDVFAVESRTYKHIDYTTGKIYDTSFNTMWKCINDNNIPAVLYLSKGRGEGCGRCERWYTNVEDKHKSDIANTQYLWFGGNYTKHANEYSALDRAMNALGLETPGTWIYIYLYWKKEDGTVVKWTSGSISPPENYWKNVLKPKMDNLFAGYEGQTQIEYVINPTITTFGKGEGLSVAYISSTGNRWICTNDTVTKSADYRVDNYTVDNFKYGIWYGNIKQLHEFAKANHIPLVAEWSSAGCDPCIDFRRRVWQNKEFQDKIKSKSCLFCRIEAESTEHFNTPGTQQHYISHILGDSKKYIPQLVFYWLESNGTEHKDIWVYDYRGDPANANYQTVLSKVDALTSTYTSSTAYSPILLNMSVNGKYQYYDNQHYDMNGQFFICDFKKSIQSYSDTKLSIDVTNYSTGGLGDALAAEASDSVIYKVLDSIAIGQAVDIPKLTYQYYTTADNASFADQNGVIFKVDDQYYVGDRAIYLVNDSWEYANGDVVPNAELATKQLKAGIQYIYSFENYVHVEQEIKLPEKYQTGQMIECNSSTLASSFDDILDFGGQNPEKLIVIVEMPATGSTIESDLLQKNEFIKWMKNSGYLFVKVKSNDWSSNAPKALIDLEEYVKFDDNTVGAGRPKILVFKHCVTCSLDQYGAVYCKKTILYESSKAVSYYTALIDSYSKI